MDEETRDKLYENVGKMLMKMPTTNREGNIGISLNVSEYVGIGLRTEAKRRHMSTNGLINYILFEWLQRVERDRKGQQNIPKALTSFDKFLMEQEKKKSENPQ